MKFEEELIFQESNMNIQYDKKSIEKQ